jgi:hypothetical protein
MRKAVIGTCLCLGVALPSARLHAQEPQQLSPGIRLRISAPEQASGRIVGTLVSVDAAVLTIQTSKQRIAVRREAIRALESSERRSSKKKGALIGAGIGAVAAIVVALTDKQEPFLGSDPLFTREELGLVAAAAFVPVGVGLGALLAPGERWTPVATAGAAKAAGPGPPRIGLRFTLRIRV